MDTKKIFQPNINKILMGLFLFLIIGAETWIPILSVVLKAGISLLSQIRWPIFKILSSFIVGYVISCYFVTYFKKEHITELPLVVKILIIYLFFQLLIVLYQILINIKPSLNSYFIPTSAYLFGGNFALYTALLSTSLVFLVLKIEKKYLISSLFFLFMLINPYSVTGQMIFSPNFQGPVFGILISMFISLTQGNIMGMFIGFGNSLFPISVLVYFYLKNNKEEKLLSEKAMMIIIVLTFLAYKYGYLLFR